MNVVAGFLLFSLLAALASCYPHPNPCAQYRPCQNGGQCQNLYQNAPYGYRCICNGPWGGLNCDLSLYDTQNAQYVEMTNNTLNIIYRRGRNRHSHNDTHHFFSDENENLGTFYPNNLNNNNPNPSSNDNNQNGNLKKNNPNNKQWPYDNNNIYLQWPPNPNNFNQWPISNFPPQVTSRPSFWQTSTNYWSRQQNQKAMILAIVLGTTLPFFGLVILITCVAYCCWVHRRQPNAQGQQNVTSIAK